MNTAREEIMAEAAEYMANLKPVMVRDLTETPNSARTVFVGAARIDDVEGIVHIVQTGRKIRKNYASFTPDEVYRERWGS